MRILLEQSGYKLINFGDWAMLAEGVRRIRELIPSAEIHVLCDPSAPLESCVEGVQRVSTADRDRFVYADYFCANKPLIGPIVKRLMRCQPKLAIWLLCRGSALIRRDVSQFKSFYSFLNSCDAVVSTGGGFINDGAIEQVSAISAMFQISQSLGKRTAMFGQGIGPLENPTFRIWSKAAFRNLDLITLREPNESADIASKLEFARGQVIVTGDDATSLGYTARQESIGADVGVNIRTAGYASVEQRALLLLGGAFKALAIKCDSTLRVIPIAFHEDDNSHDWVSTWEVIGSGPVPQFDFPKPMNVVAEVAKCRIVVTGSYHAAVFALSQGIPVIGLASSQYYKNKFAGLSALYGEHCTVVSLTSEDEIESVVDLGFTMYKNAASKRAQVLEISDQIVSNCDHQYLSYFSTL